MLARRTVWEAALCCAIVLALATAVRALLQTLLGDLVLFAPYYPAVLAVTLLVGWQAGAAVAACAALLANWLFAPGLFSPSPRGTAAIVVFVVSAGAVVGAAQWLRTALQNLELGFERETALNAELQQRVKNTLDAELRAAAESRKLQLALDATELGFWEYDIASDDVAWDARTRALFSFPPDRTVDFATYAAALHPEDRPTVLAIYNAALSGENDGSYVAIHRTADGARWLRGYGQVIFDNFGKATRVLGTIKDITEEIEARDHQYLLMAELNHRVKNNLSTVQSIATQAARTAKDVPAFLASFEGRLVALARTHDVLTANSWAGANMRQVLRSEVECFDDRVLLAGPDLVLTAKMAQALGLIVHELSTNAAKYGALSVPSGCVELDWRLQSGVCQLTWREVGGPLARKPELTGFGSRLIARLVNGDLGGNVTVEYPPQGLVFRACFQVEPAQSA
jgi:two-component sensor histidine kinase/PAS domain-containing protein